MDRRPNVLVILGDQHNATCLGVEGHPQAITPNLDRLATSGMRFTAGYSQHTICLPSRTSLLSGQYPHNHGYYGNTGPTPRLPSLFAHFRTHGYRTAGIGHLHLPGDWTDGALDLEALCYDDHPTDGVEVSPYFDYLTDLGLRELEDSVGLPELPGVQQLEGRPSALPFEHSVEGWSVQQATDFIASGVHAGDDRPFFIELAFPKPHQCFTPAQQFWDLYPDDLDLPPTLDQDVSGRPPHFRATYDAYHRNDGLLQPRGFEHLARRIWHGYLGCISHVDHAVGLVLDTLDRHGLAEDTIVFYGADHGGYSGLHGISEKAPGICSEAVCRIPYLWRVPGVTAPGTVTGHLAQSIDLAATLPGLCGLPAMDTVDGADLTPLLRGDDQPVHQVVVTENTWSKALRWNNWRFVHYQPESFNDGSADNVDVGELYDLAADPDESHNRYHDPAYQQIVQQCRRLLLEWLIRTTRAVSIHPDVDHQRGNAPLHLLGGDGKENNHSGATARIRAGYRNYI